jgi:hypothetical protein
VPDTNAFRYLHEVTIRASDGDEDSLVPGHAIEITITQDGCIPVVTLDGRHVAVDPEMIRRAIVGPLRQQIWQIAAALPDTR